MSTARRRLPRSRTWLRVLVLLLALLVPGAQAETAPMMSPGETVGYDLPEVALRPASLPAQRADVPLRPEPLPGAAPGRPARRPRHAPAWPPYAPGALRSVVLRC
jgi:hypothetical protein